MAEIEDRRPGTSMQSCWSPGCEDMEEYSMVLQQQVLLVPQHQTLSNCTSSPSCCRKERYSRMRSCWFRNTGP